MGWNSVLHNRAGVAHVWVTLGAEHEGERLSPSDAI